MKSIIKKAAVAMAVLLLVGCRNITVTVQDEVLKGKKVENYFSGLQGASFVV